MRRRTSAFHGARGTLAALDLDAKHLPDLVAVGAKATTVGGGAVYCDSCHQGQLRFPDRSDTRALSAWMQANYVDRLRLRDGSRVECVTCHGRPFEPHIFQKLWSTGKGRAR